MYRDAHHHYYPIVIIKTPAKPSFAQSSCAIHCSDSLNAMHRITIFSLSLCIHVPFISCFGCNKIHIIFNFYHFYRLTASPSSMYRTVCTHRIAMWNNNNKIVEILSLNGVSVLWLLSSCSSNSSNHTKYYWTMWIGDEDDESVCSSPLQSEI